GADLRPRVAAPGHGGRPDDPVRVRLVRARVHPRRTRRRGADAAPRGSDRGVRRDARAARPHDRAGVMRAVRAVRILARDDRIPRRLRWLVALGVLPVPGPVDEAVLVLAAGILFAVVREPLRGGARPGAIQPG